MKLISTLSLFLVYYFKVQMTCIPGMTSSSLSAAVALRTGKIIPQKIFSLKKKSLLNIIIHFSFGKANRQILLLKIRIYSDESRLFWKGGLALASYHFWSHLSIPYASILMSSWLASSIFQDYTSASWQLQQMEYPNDFPYVNYE